MTGDLRPIGHVAEATGLSLRTIRYYDEIGLVTPSGRSAGGFRLYDDRDIERLLLIKRMKPLGYPLEEIARLLRLVDAVDDTPDEARSGDDALEQLRSYASAVDERISNLKIHVAYAQEFRERLERRIAHRTPR